MKDSQYMLEKEKYVERYNHISNERKNLSLGFL